MASLFKRPNSPFFFCRYLGSDGVWSKKSTKLKDRKKALEWCLALQAAEDSIGRGSASEAQLRQIINETMQRISGQDIAMPSVREWLDQWLEARAGANAPHTLTKYKQSIKDFLAFLGQKADGRLESVSQSDVIKFRSHLTKEGKSPATVNQMLAKIVAAPFRQAFSQGLIRHNPTAGLPKLTDTGRMRKQAFTLEQVRKLLKVAPGEWKGAILCGYTTGMRLGDVVNLSWESIDFDNEVIAFRQSKTQTLEDDATVIGLHPDFKAWLLKQKAKKGPVFPGLEGRQSSGRSGLSGEFGRLMKTAGIESANIREKIEDSKGRTVKALSFHSFRHSAASAVFKGKLIEQAQKHVTGHGRGKQVKTYTHIDIDAVKAATGMIPRI